MVREDSKRITFDVFRSVLYAVIITMALILLFAIIVKFAELGEDVIRPVNQAIKVLSIFAGLMMGIKIKEKGLSKGFFTGLIFTALSIALFSFMSLEPVFTLSNLIEILAGSIIGAVCGAIVLMIKK
jgi:putative membrane protein (TIGR04086 family)